MVKIGIIIVQDQLVSLTDYDSVASTLITLHILGLSNLLDQLMLIHIMLLLEVVGVVVAEI